MYLFFCSLIVYGYYDDISPEEFLDTQLDIDYRKKWDDTVLKLEIIESDKKNSQDFIYWEMKWPTMFSNRDYLFARRHLVDKDQQSMVILSKFVDVKLFIAVLRLHRFLITENLCYRSVPHHSVPERKGIHRVKEYWSVMQVKAVKGFSEVWTTAEVPTVLRNGCKMLTFIVYSPVLSSD